MLSDVSWMLNSFVCLLSTCCLLAFASGLFMDGTLIKMAEHFQLFESASSTTRFGELRNNWNLWNSFSKHHRQLRHDLRLFDTNSRTYCHLKRVFKCDTFYVPFHTLFIRQTCHTVMQQKTHTSQRQRFHKRFVSLRQLDMWIFSPIIFPNFQTFTVQVLEMADKRLTFKISAL
jgi:hypothetical protein